MNETNFAIRTVRDGRVLIHGQVFRVDEQYQHYDGCLDGMRFAFGRYPVIGGEGYEPVVSLWGTEHRYYCPETIESNCQACAIEPHVVDGYLPWLWWRA